jgi:hypothetical protein
LAPSFFKLTSIFFFFKKPNPNKINPFYTAFTHQSCGGLGLGATSGCLISEELAWACSGVSTAMGWLCHEAAPELFLYFYLFIYII